MREAEGSLDRISLDQAEVVGGWLDRTGRHDLDILEVGCGAGWLCSRLNEYGSVVATDLSDEVLERAQQRNPDVEFRAGDFMQMDFGTERFDVLVTLEVLSHVFDHKAFVSKLASHLRPRGLLMLATQNRPVLQNLNRIPPPAEGQLRRWFDRYELAELLDAEFRIDELFSITPRSNRGVMRIVNSEKLNRPLRAVVGKRIDRFKESLWLGWTLMVLAQKR
ncbi:MAG: methyltransferase domain-containing protein [Oricola sp.]